DAGHGRHRGHASGAQDEMRRANVQFIILLTAKREKQDIVVALEAGADDYLTKPFDREELGARVWAGMRLVNLQRNLADRVQQLEAALARVKQLQGMLPLCSY